VSSTVLYQHFESKAAILREIRTRGVRTLAAELRAATGTTPAKRLSVMAERYVGYALSNPWLYRLLFTNEPVDWASIESDEREELLAPLRVVREFLATAKEEGGFPNSLDVDHTALTLWASMHGLAAMLLDGRISDSHPMFPVNDTQGFVRGYIEAIVRGFQVPSP
jgi:AcrR family transcriptional regulator